MPDLAIPQGKHLWEINHPYYCSEGNFYKNGLANRFASWQEFTETLFYSGDPELNLLFRWDWQSWRRHPDPDLRGDSPDELLLFFVLQRKASQCSASIQITDEDEPAVRAWLAERVKTIAAVWEPFDLTPPDTEKPEARKPRKAAYVSSDGDGYFYLRCGECREIVTCIDAGDGLDAINDERDTHTCPPPDGEADGV